MHCPNCGYAHDADEVVDACVECGAPLNASEHEEDGQGDPDGRYAAEDEGYPDEGYANEGYANEEDNPDGHAQGFEEEWDQPAPVESFGDRASRAMGPLFAAVTQVGGTFQALLDEPRFRAVLPGGSLTLLGVALVVLGLLFSVVPFIAGVGVVGTLLLLGLGTLAAVNEWRLVTDAPEFEGRSLPYPPAVLERLPEGTMQPVVGQVFALLTCTYALLMMGYGPISWVWLLAAGALGYDQGRRYFVPPEDEWEEGGGMQGWVVAGVVLCSFSLLLPWTRGSTLAPGESGGEQPLAALTQAMLLFLGCSAVKHRGFGGVHPFFLILMTVWLTLWFFLMKYSYSVGPWVFLPGVLMIVVVVVRHLLPRRAPAEPEQESDLDLQG